MRVFRADFVENAAILNCDRHILHTDVADQFHEFFLHHDFDVRDFTDQRQWLDDAYLVWQGSEVGFRDDLRVAVVDEAYQYLWTTADLTSGNARWNGFNWVDGLRMRLHSQIIGSLH